MAMVNALDRRSFLSLGALAAALPACLHADGGGTCAAVGHPAPMKPLDGPLASTDSPILKAVKFTPLSIDVGAKKPFKAIHSSDTHLNFMTVGDLIGAAAERDLAMYEERRKQLNTLVPFAACALKARQGKMPLLHTGDVWDYDSIGNMLIAQDAFVQAGDVFYALGNHEMGGHWGKDPSYSASACRHRIQPYLPNSVLCAARMMFGVNFVSFDDTRSCADRQADIEAFVKSEFSKGYPVVLMVHLPLLTDELCSDFVEGKGCMAGRKKVDPRHLSGYGYGNKRHERAFVDWILAQKNLKTVLCGHLHHEAHCRLSETVVQHVAGAAMNGLACEITFN